MDCPCGKFGDCSFSCFGFSLRTDRRTDTQNHTHTHTHTVADDRYTHATQILLIDFSK